MHDASLESSPGEPDPADELASLAAALEAHLSRREELGVERVARPARPQAKPSPAPARAPATAEPARATVESGEVLHTGALFSDAGGRAPEPPLARANRAEAAACTGLGELRALVASCTACGLAKTRTQTVFADGRAGARVMFIGEAPGQHEDEQGVPFVGAAGQLLTDIIQKGMGLARSEVYIANVLKCRPPGNRDPEEEEKALCTPFLDRQIELVDPELLITLGLHATRHVLRSPLSMGRLRGKVHLWNGRKVVPTYHPSFLLRTPSAKKDCWQDIQLAMRELGLAPPERSGGAPGSAPGSGPGSAPGAGAR